jgi:hypothetical protein
MFWLIENKSQLDDLMNRVKHNRGFKEAFIEIIPSSPSLHPIETDVSLIYLRPLWGQKGYILVVDHSEALCEISEYLMNTLKVFNRLYTWDKKNFFHFYAHKDVIDLSLLAPDFKSYETKAHVILKQRGKKIDDVNKLIPIVKHYESCEKNFNELKSKFNGEVNKFYNNIFPLVFNAIERSGIQVDTQLYEDYFDKSSQSRVHTQYNYRTTTTRPSNRFGGVNYAALNKENGCRKAFIPRNHQFIELDISAYHPTLASQLIDYEFDCDDIHESFAQMYNVDYKKAKELTFKQLYGGVFEKYKDLEFFKKIQVFVDDLWDEFCSKGFIECPISSYKFEKEKLDEMNPQKLFNYLLQNLETAKNVVILWQILKLIQKRKTKLVLYTYDSFLFDYHKEDKEIMKEVLDVFKKYNLKIKMKHGRNYDFE